MALTCRCNAYLRNSFAFHCFAPRCLAFAYQFDSLHFLALAMHCFSTPLQISSIHSIAFAPRLCALPRHCDSLLLHTLPLLIKDTPCIHSHRFALPFNATAFLCYSVASHFQSSLVIAIDRLILASPCLCKSRQISASPLPLKSLRHQSLP